MSKENDREKIIASNYDAIYSFCRRRVDSDDTAYEITQTVFLAFLEGYSSIGDNGHRQWLFNVAKNKIADHYRAKNKIADHYRAKKTEVDNRISTELDDEKMGLVDDPFEKLTAQDFEKHMSSIMQDLTSDEKELCADLRKYNNKEIGYAEIAEKNSVTEAAMRKRISRLKAKITKAIGALLYIFAIK